MSKSLTVKELLTGAVGAKAFDPLTIDTSEIRELSSLIPSNGSIDLNQAEIYAAKYLRGADMCAELLAIASSYASRCDTEKKKAYSNAAIAKASAAGVKTDKSRLLFADGDDDYIEACNKHGEAVAFVRWVSSKYDSLVRGHYMMKQMLNRGYQHERASSFSPDPEKMVTEENNRWTNETPEDDGKEGW
jgi:hypothetical protein